MDHTNPPPACQPSQNDWELRRRRAELANLQTALAARDGELAECRQQLAAFERRYFRAFSSHYAELDALDALIAEKAAQVRPLDRAKQRKAERLRAKADGSWPSGEQEPRDAVAPKLRPPDELRALYRALSKLVHPDLSNGDGERERREALMARANAAYATGDQATLSHMLGSHAEEGTDAPDPLAWVMRQIEAVSRRLEVPLAERAVLENTDLARLMRRVSRAEAEGRDLFAKLAEGFEEEKREARKRIKALDRRLAKRAEAPDGP